MHTIAPGRLSPQWLATIPRHGAIIGLAQFGSWEYLRRVVGLGRSMGMEVSDPAQEKGVVRMRKRRTPGGTWGFPFTVGPNSLTSVHDFDRD